MTTKIGTVRTLRRYPVKSMQGEDFDQAPVTEGGIIGDRGFALIDKATGKVASAKYPKKWRKLIQFSASFTKTPTAEGPLPPLSITQPDGTVLIASGGDLDAELSNIIGREVTLTSVQPDTVSVERLDPLAEDEIIVDIGDFMMKGRFADYAPIHLITTASLAELAKRSPNAQFDLRRFRPNIVVEAPDGQTGFVENEWVGAHYQHRQGGASSRDRPDTSMRLADARPERPSPGPKCHPHDRRSQQSRRACVRWSRAALCRYLCLRRANRRPAKRR